jgi:hypothetical protein
MKELNFLLEREHIYFKASQVYKRGDSVECTILPYKDARTDMDILDDIVGSDNWKNDYKRDEKGVLQGGIGLWSEDKQQWIWKWSNGKPSQFESEKGEYSDAFKRAGFMWGIGRCLYRFPEIRLILNEKEWYEKEGKVKIAGWFKPNQFRWKVSGEIDDLHIQCAQKFSNSWKIRYDNKPNK